MWNKKSIINLQDDRLKDYQLVVVSATEPYVHSFTSKGIVAKRSAGGVVAALEPIIQINRGLWLAHARGNADRDVADPHLRLKVPPRHPTYTLRRVWVSKKIFQGWYNGFSNRTLWPLCHQVFERPHFAETDWKAYERVNRQFADAVLTEVKDKAIVWIQDYHFALLPKMLREKRPDLLIAHFWHIPWPIVQIFRICPWEKEILEGMLGNELIGFQSLRHTRNFLETVSRVLEAKVDNESMTVTYKDHTTLVRPFPISIDYQAVARVTEKIKGQRKTFLKKYLSSSYEYLAVGVERVDYIKGILERFRAIDRFLAKYPKYQKKFTYLGVATPSRSLIPRYDTLQQEIKVLAAVINSKYRTRSWQPINLVNLLLPPAEIYKLYRQANMILVTSLDDGMNLVAKEYIAAGPKDGVIILSEQAGAARELSDSIIVNPYDIEGVAESIRLGVEMPAEERQKRMTHMRATVAKNNVYRWAGKFLLELTDWAK